MADCPPRFATQRSPERKSLGYAAVNVARALGHEPMPWQEQIYETALEIDPTTGRFAYRQVVIGTPRQSGKTSLCLSMILTRALGLPSQNIVFTAQTGSDARKKLIDDWLPVLDNSEFARHYRKRMTNGHESLKFTNGSRVGLVASTVKAGHGSTLDMAIIDEAFAQPDNRLEQSLLPAMITRPQPMTVIVSTAGALNSSPFLREKVEAGRQAVEADVRHSVAYFEWSAPDDAPIDDPATWRACMPALGHTITEDAVRASFNSMPRKEFARAFLNIWTTSVGEPAIDLDAWDELADPDAPRPDDLVLLVDIAPGSKSAAIAAAGVRDGILYVSVLEHGEGTGWLVPRLEALTVELGPSEIIGDGRSVGSLLTGYQGAARLTETTAADMAQGCTTLLDLVANRRLRHRGERELVTAIDGAARRTLGDSFGWSRKNSSIDISPLCAITLGAYAFSGYGLGGAG